MILLLSASSLIGFLLTALAKNAFATIDVYVNSWSASIQTYSATRIAEIIAYGFDTTVLFVISLLIAAFIFYKNHRMWSILLAGAMFGDAVIITIVKSLVHSARPLNGLMQETGFSFPSGHVTSTTVLFGFLFYFAWQNRKTSSTRLLSVICLILIELVVGFSRIYLNVHWLSDVLGGYLIGVFWLTFSLLALQHLGKIQKFRSYA